ncbi:MAG TPA: aldehyde dehydrogenase family protein [Acidimicrobiales bacterium]|jgi:acyl-CoA reductase-like NAD-dependent aldehyde dehydrogenase|nr:aldehyde dehydrogenase family protein [Acidimicrobiales bacterium]
MPDDVPPADAPDVWSASGEPVAPAPPRLAVRKTYKLYVGGKFPRSESGRSYEVLSARDGSFLANAALGSRKDARDAVVAARSAVKGWSGATAYNRGQVLYRVAEVMEGRRAQFVDEVGHAEGLRRKAAEPLVDAAIDRWVWYAGWADKLAQVDGSTNPVAGPYIAYSVPEASGVAAVIAPQRSSLLGLVSVVAPAIVSGGTCVVLASETAPLPAVTLGEVLATSDVPGGVVNVLTGRVPEVAPWLASHGDVDCLDLTGVEDPLLAIELEVAAAEGLTRVLRPPTGDVDWFADPGLSRMRHFLETKSVWHPAGT